MSESEKGMEKEKEVEGRRRAREAKRRRKERTTIGKVDICLALTYYVI